MAKYEIDPYVCNEHYHDCTVGYLGDIVPNCIKHCPAKALRFSDIIDQHKGPYCYHYEINQNVCIKCGECATYCYHNAVIKDGERTIMTWKRAGRLIAKGTLKGLGGDLLGEIWDKIK